VFSEVITIFFVFFCFICFRKLFDDDDDDGGGNELVLQNSRMNPTARRNRPHHIKRPRNGFQPTPTTSETKIGSKPLVSRTFTVSLTGTPTPVSVLSWFIGDAHTTCMLLPTLKFMLVSPVLKQTRLN